jgi:lauroyl/myristoyl acyltransferase
VRERLKKGKRVGMTFDVMGGHVVHFFGRPAALASGFAHFVCDTGASIVPVSMLRGTRPLNCRLIVDEPIEYEP